ncbi:MULTISPECIES: recombinase family protein [Bradyrhizobium]|uniref:DNA invertase Pin-like site-specific DNA recombinase n=1 Tax=Bradyrhizobium elkanii TaxID=29448 RepID=A0A8I2C6E7_BRAEL|nr:MULTISPECIES: recombinase family protein [Bradyrhizobium]MBP1299330.1 DNA invertase Pin-like site-specific DNA recombinase [Bradyrhizobium elkanii]MCP1929812.1 DNA invertase Pin-like site-specific DNA recombinase [Bradyrhizobium elkanii]MCS3579573.1 DNA invertase Pin-like site-specific DNA recombinase [Bradyrhizobium elkanii]MCS3722444.1 DNA invertase Pin-like site-specific DNA recombinase [Bradyrhizobium elkanii]MCS4006860.1 DNA invertase Pin-like site-specific DNA recombinase [Bradyrhizob
MAAEARNALRCAVYTRKSTEHGLDQEFNSLDAQREACEAYIKSQASQGWKALPQHYDDPAYSGGNLDRPALKQLLADIEADRVDVVVVYKIDRLTRSLADFAKLVETFDARSISFVAVTQQFNTTTSMGRLTLNVLLSFAQFERELASERVRDKVAASRKKGKWTGGTVPLGYEAKNRKLVIDKAEAETVRTIFRLYLELRSFGKLVAELDRRKIVTKRRDTKVPKYRGGIPFTYGPLSHLLRNRIYLGQIHHGGKWFKGEHDAILDQKMFDEVQSLLKANVIDRKASSFKSGSLLQGKLFDDRGNRMGPSFSSKNGVRYRFYVSRALRGRKHKAGTVARVSAPEIEGLVETAIQARINDPDVPREETLNRVERIVVTERTLRIALGSGDDGKSSIEIPWVPKTLSNPETQPVLSEGKTDPKLLQAMIRARVWLNDLRDGRYATIEDLAAANKVHPKVVRQGLRLAFLSPASTSAILDGDRAIKLKQIPKSLPLRWREHRLAEPVGERRAAETKI